jgi:predicted nucleic acid-binding protein
MRIVIDASVAAAWFFPDEGSAMARRAGEHVANDGGIVPRLFWFEIRNALLIGERRKRFDQVVSSRFLARLDALPIDVDHRPSSDQVLALARRHSLTGYDAAYLELALRSAAPLATLDRELASAAAAQGVSLVRAR